MADLVCTCGEPARHVNVIARTSTGRETVCSCCRVCDRIMYWWRHQGPPQCSMVVDIMDRPEGRKKWPPAGWLRRHAGKVVV